VSSTKKIALLFSLAISITACGQSALYTAAYKGDNERVVSLLDSGENINEKGRDD
jgi:ankyrin repeat protein